MNTPPRRRTVSKRVPLPVSVHLHNFCSTTDPQHAKKWFRPEHSSSLLKDVVLQLVVHDTKILYNAPSEARTVSPCWQHLNEAIAVNDLSVEEYESMTAQFFIASQEESGEDAPPFKKEMIHPSQLIKIDQVPENLPLNALVVTFSDESIRVHQSLYQLLVEAKEVSVVDKSHVSDKDPSFDTSYSRFEDDVFRTLDQVTPTRSKSLLETDDDTKATPIHVVSENEFADIDSSDIEGNEAGMSPIVQPFLGEEVANAVDRNSSFLGDEEAARDADLFAWQKLLESELEEEETALKEELMRLRVVKEEATMQIDEIHKKMEQTQEVEDATCSLVRDHQKTTFLLEAQRIRLFCNLRVIYPITVELDRQYRIRGLQIPEAVFGSGVPDEEFFAALGYLCHLLQMMSRYLDVKLRYVPLCQSSTSQIQDDRGSKFPLYLGRNVERERFEQGVRLLGRNVECLCRVRQMRVPSNLPILARVKRVYENVIDGY